MSGLLDVIGDLGDVGSVSWRGVHKEGRTRARFQRNGHHMNVALTMGELVSHQPVYLDW